MRHKLRPALKGRHFYDCCNMGLNDWLEHKLNEGSSGISQVLPKMKPSLHIGYSSLALIVLHDEGYFFCFFEALFALPGSMWTLLLERMSHLCRINKKEKLKWLWQKYDQYFSQLIVLHTRVVREKLADGFQSALTSTVPLPLASQAQLLMFSGPMCKYKLSVWTHSD